VLILTRKLGESITIGDKIKITVVDCQGKQVKLGITAPKQVIVHREEIYEKIQEENMKASKVSKDAIMKAAQNLKKSEIKADKSDKDAHSS